MKTGRLIRAVAVSTCLLGFSGPGQASVVNYFGYDQFGGTWYDAEKTPGNTQDDLMCWAAAASNLLRWTGWAAGFSGEDSMFAHFQDHWKDVGGYTSEGWAWWFDGQDRPDVDVSGGGGFYTSYNFSDYYHGYSADLDAMPKVAEYLHAGYGVSIGVRPSGTGGHAITAWGYRYDDVTDTILGIWVTDSDDDKSSDTPPDVLAYYDVTQTGGTWYLNDFYGADWWIDDVWALEKFVPEPSTLALSLVFLLGLVRLRSSGSLRLWR